MIAAQQDAGGMRVQDAREIVAHHDLYDVIVICDACSVLRTHGDWMDYERAAAVERLIADSDSYRREARARRLKTIIEIVGDVIGAIAFFGIVVGLLFLALLFSPN
jgi:hypothetical protein